MVNPSIHRTFSSDGFDGYAKLKQGDRKALHQLHRPVTVGRQLFVIRNFSAAKNVKSSNNIHCMCRLHLGLQMNAAVILPAGDLQTKQCLINAISAVGARLEMTDDALFSPCRLAAPCPFLHSLPHLATRGSP